jgi:hypothetical protein
VLAAAIAAAARDDGWATLSRVGSLIVKNHPSFDPRNYGCQKLSELVRQQTYIDAKSVAEGGGSPIVHLHIRLKDS